MSRQHVEQMDQSINRSIDCNQTWAKLILEKKTTKFHSKNRLYEWNKINKKAKTTLYRFSWIFGYKFFSFQFTIKKNENWLRNSNWKWWKSVNSMFVCDNFRFFFIKILTSKIKLKDFPLFSTGFHIQHNTTNPKKKKK